MTLKRRPQPVLPSEALAPLADDLELKAARAAEAAIVARMAESEARRARAVSRLRPRDSKKGAAAVVRSLLDGAMLPGASPEAEAAAADEELGLLNARLIAQRQVIAGIVDQRSFDASKDCAAEYHAELVAAFRAMEALHVAAVACRAIKLRLYAAGYNPSGIVLPDIGVRSVLQLGDPHSPDAGRNEAAAFRKRLEALGVNTK